MNARRSFEGVVVAMAMSLAGCATADLRPGIVRHTTPEQIRSRFHGPDVSIQATVVLTSNSRMIQPRIRLDDSAYVVIGDIGDDGTLRIIYPVRPGDPNLIRKGDKFVAPRFQPRMILPFRQNAFTSVRTAPGFAFVIASSIPLDLHKLAEGERWSTFDVYYDNFLNDPRPAIVDLAAAISTNVGEVNISYTPYSWGLVGPRRSSAQQMTPDDWERRPTRPPR